MQQRTCSDPECESPILCKGLCRKHYMAAWKARQSPPPPCSIEGCEKPTTAAGYCSMHYSRWHKHGDPLTKKHKHDGNRLDLAQRKLCPECGREFGPTPGRAHAQWKRQLCCSPVCANAYRNRGHRPPRFGELTARALGREKYKLEYGRRKAMPQWAAWWEDMRRAEDLADLAPTPPKPGPQCWLGMRPKARQWINGSCPGCSCNVTVIRGWWHHSIRCPSCTKRKWRMNHRQRAKHYGVAYEFVDDFEVFAADGYRCQICGDKTRGKHPNPLSATIDHIIPMSVGGPHLRHNLQTAHKTCNEKKGNRAANDQLRMPLAV